jgi:hypothetical protein
LQKALTTRRAKERIKIFFWKIKNEKKKGFSSGREKNCAFDTNKD